MLVNGRAKNGAMSQQWNANYSGNLQLGTLLHLDPNTASGGQPMPNVGDTFRFSGDGTETMGQAISRFSYLVDVEVQGRGLITIKPAPFYHLSRLTRRWSSTPTFKWIIV